MSIFTRFEYDPDDPDCIWRLSRRVFDQSNPFVEVLVHAPSKRARASRYGSDLPGYALRVGSPRSDLVTNLEGVVPYSHSKLRGGPVFYDATEDATALCQELLEQGFQHVLQLSFPNVEDAVVDGSWPFGEWIFHVFARVGQIEGGAQADGFRFIWG
jgi:hypothetical protein